MTFGMTLIF
jgi:hypothetical protein